MKFIALFLLTFCTLFQAGCQSQNHPEAENAAIKAANSWLVLVDSSKFEESWEKSATFFQGAVSKDNWVKSMQSVRVPLGNLISREVKSKEYHTTLPGAPDGEYVVIQFNTSFENKKSAIETVIPMLDKDNKWRVSGYYIK
jgi:hypothetical protein